jgi:hypothetical protein
MQELSCTVRGNHYTLPSPFLVLATQNPIELEGTYPLPEAQLDRFLMRIPMGYPNREAELAILQQQGERTHTADELHPVVSAAEVADASTLVVGVHIACAPYLRARSSTPRRHPDLMLKQASSLAIQRRAALARATGAFVIPDDVKRVFPAVIEHRVIVAPPRSSRRPTATWSMPSSRRCRCRAPQQLIDRAACVGASIFSVTLTARLVAGRCSARARRGGFSSARSSHPRGRCSALLGGVHGGSRRGAPTSRCNGVKPDRLHVGGRPDRPLGREPRQDAQPAARATDWFDEVAERRASWFLRSPEERPPAAYCVPTRRGRYRVGPLSPATDPFGLASRAAECRRQRRVVRPRRRHRGASRRPGRVAGESDLPAQRRW